MQLALSTILTNLKQLKEKHFTNNKRVLNDTSNKLFVLERIAVPRSRLTPNGVSYLAF